MKPFTTHNPLLKLFKRPLISVSVLIAAGIFSTVLPSIGLSATDLLEVELAHDIKEREPDLPYKPPAHCEKDTNQGAALPRIHPSDQQVVFWNRVAATDSTLIRHAWHKKFEGSWKPMANVDLPIQKSSAFRIWSTKDLHPTLHRDEWMIVVSMADDPKQVLCITRFIVE